MESTVAELVKAARSLSKSVDALSFSPPVFAVYNPLAYARAGYEQYLARFAHAPLDVLLVGMNPGPWGMAQTGVPFGEIGMVTTWMGLHAEIKKPAREHPARPVDGFSCARHEVSGARLWGAVAAKYARPANFFARHLVLTYCPLMFLEESGRNLTPDKLKKSERGAVEAVCDAHLRRAVAVLRPRMVLPIGGYADKRVRAVVDVDRVAVPPLPHPSPASPQANRGWAKLARAALISAGIAPFL